MSNRLKDIATLLKSADQWIEDSGHWAKTARGVSDDGMRGASDLIFDLATVIRNLRTEDKDYQHSFDLYAKASRALMDAYKKAHPDLPDNVWPDTTKVNVWAATEIERLLHLPVQKFSPEELELIDKVLGQHRFVPFTLRGKVIQTIGLLIK